MAKQKQTTKAQQECRISGVVYDERHAPLSGARVSLIGTGIDAVTDERGAFTLASAGRSAARLECRAPGRFAKTAVWDPVDPRPLDFSLDPVAACAAGAPADIARLGYFYRKGARRNPAETMWLRSHRGIGSLESDGWDVLTGALWEEPQKVERVEVEYPFKDMAPDAVQWTADHTRVMTTDTHWWREIHRSTNEDKGYGHGPMETLTREETAAGPARLVFRAATERKPGQPGKAGAPMVVPMGGQDVRVVSEDEQVKRKAAKLLVACDAGVDWGGPLYGCPVVRIFAEGKCWAAPRRIEIEWGLDGEPPRAFDGSVEAWQGFLGEIEPLPGGAVEALGAHHFRDTGKAEQGRRGLAVTVYQLADGATNVTVRTGAGAVTFGAADLDRGPILTPGPGVYVTMPGGPTGEQFRRQWAAERRPTIRQRVNARPEQSWAGAMGAFYEVERLPAFPEPPFETPMRIDVPEKALVSQWRLAGWHLSRHMRQVGPRMATVPIWPPNDKHANTIACESYLVCEALDLVGMHEAAERGLNFWLLAEPHERGFNPAFTDMDGYLLRDNHYDERHACGHGLILKAAARHGRLTRNRVWSAEAAPVLVKACRFTLRQKQAWNDLLPAESRHRGLLPPMASGDFTNNEAQVFFIQALTYYAGLKATADFLIELQAEGADALAREAETWREELRAAVLRAAGDSRVARGTDGAYRRTPPYDPYWRRSPLGMDPATASSTLSVRFLNMEYFAGGNIVPAYWGVLDGHEPVAREALDCLADTLVDWHARGGAGLDYRGVSLLDCKKALGPARGRLDEAEAWFAIASHLGRWGQLGWEKMMDVCLLNDEIPMFLRAFYNGYAADIIPANGYTFCEHPCNTDPRGDKVHEEAAFIERLRNLLVLEISDALWLARATPRAWLEQGKKISVKNAPTCFGTVAYEIVSDVDNGRINATVELPSRNAPAAVHLRFRHPKAAPIQGVTVNGPSTGSGQGKEWTAFDKAKEAIELKGLTGTVSVTAAY